MRQEQVDKIKEEVLTHLMVELNRRFYLIPRLVVINEATLQEYMGIAMHFVCNYHAVTIEELSSKSQRQRIVFPRQLFFYILRRHFGSKMSFECIGQYIHKDHATVMHGVKKVQNLMDTDVHTRLHVEEVFDKFFKTIKELEFKADIQKIKQSA